ncbi:MAG: hypothetical protein JW797_10125 [Bradymonadales bacterium]|nr:hypothetical protein [Bradymonadales bacterium]
MKAHIIKIGNSKGIRIPQVLLEQAGISGEVELIAREGAILIRSTSRPRTGWDAAFREMAELGDDLLLEGDRTIDHSFDREEWEWR